jgi:hypothetical protein
MIASISLPIWSNACVIPNVTKKVQKCTLLLWDLVIDVFGPKSGSHLGIRGTNKTNKTKGEQHGNTFPNNIYDILLSVDHVPCNIPKSSG